MDHDSDEAPPHPPSPPPPPPEDLAAPPPPPDSAVPPPPPDDVPPPPPVETKKGQKQGWGAKRPAATPLSVEELIRKKKDADAATAKVSILSETLNNTTQFLTLIFILA